MRAGLYARVSTGDQNPQNQLDALRAFTAARRWTPAEFVDHGFSVAGQLSERFLTLPLSDSAKRKIMWNNCATLYGLA